MIAKGQVVVFTSGQYDDYSIDGIYRAQQDFDESEQIKKYVASDSFKREEGWGHERRFVLWLANEGLIVPMGSAAKEQYIHDHDFYGE